VSINDLRSKVIGKAEEKAKKIREDAERKAKEIVESAKEEYLRRYKRVKEAALSELRAQEFRKYTSRVMELNKELLETKQKLIKEIIDEAKEKLTHLTPEVRKESLKKLLNEALSTGVIKGSFIAEVLNNDKEIFKEVVDDLGLSSRFIKTEPLDESRLGGVLIMDPEGFFVVDNTYSTRLERALSILYSKVDKEVFKG